MLRLGGAPVKPAEVMVVILTRDPSHGPRRVKGRILSRMIALGRASDSESGFEREVKAAAGHHCRVADHVPFEPPVTVPFIVFPFTRPV